MNDLLAIICFVFASQKLLWHECGPRTHDPGIIALASQKLLWH